MCDFSGETFKIFWSAIIFYECNDDTTALQRRVLQTALWHYLLKVHLQTFLSIPITKKCQFLSCDTFVANEQLLKKKSCHRGSNFFVFCRHLCLVPMVNSFIISYYILMLNCFLGLNMEVTDNIAAVLMMPRKCDSSRMSNCLWTSFYLAWYTL